MNGGTKNISEADGVASIAVNAVSGSAITKNLEVGKTYTVEAQFIGADGVQRKLSGSFTIKDTQAIACKN